jgi:hypothetical protein
MRDYFRKNILAQNYDRIALFVVIVVKTTQKKTKTFIILMHFFTLYSPDILVRGTYFCSDIPTIAFPAIEENLVFSKNSDLCYPL